MTAWLSDHIRAWFETNAIGAPTPNLPIIAAVSGGADSMALAHGLGDAFGADAVHVATVDHGLRHGSAAEARWTVAQLADAGFATTLHTLDSKIGQSGNLQAWARTARYEVLASMAPFCAVATAHTLDDQAETVLARLARASGTRGLSGMQTVAAIPGSTATQMPLIRPLLECRRDDLRAYLKARQRRWLKDPSNRNTRFDRIRLRTLLKDWEQAGFDPARIAFSAAHLCRSDIALEYYVDIEEVKLVSTSAQGLAVQDLDAFRRLPEDIQLRLLSRLLQKAGQDDRPLRFEKLERALRRILAGKADTFTLHHSKITAGANSFALHFEARSVDPVLDEDA